MSNISKAHLWVSLIASILLLLQAGLGIYSYFTASQQKQNKMSGMKGMGQTAATSGSTAGSTSSAPAGMPNDMQNGGMKGGGNATFSVTRFESGTAGLIINLIFLIVSLCGFVLSWKIKRSNPVDVQ
ncbi:hypothetical protein [Heyndrickxia acidiproducens]|uniref:hypothetical protein n=1 Tax=Heyndrickxia acidiproducens TaxID=1121084 RepID=UPI00035C558D|nr:hypothetical protein [Heyndrickxia acidiproducens]